MRVPSPACDCVVDDCRPDQHEDNAREHAAPLSDGTNSKSDPIFFTTSVLIAFYIRKRIDVRYRGEHALIDCE